jgi:hypothetical protein
MYATLSLARNSLTQSGMVMPAAIRSSMVRSLARTAFRPSRAAGIFSWGSTVTPSRSATIRSPERMIPPPMLISAPTVPGPFFSSLHIMVAGIGLVIKRVTDIAIIIFHYNNAGWVKDQSRPCGRSQNNKHAHGSDANFMLGRLPYQVCGTAEPISCSRQPLLLSSLAL